MFREKASRAAFFLQPSGMVTGEAGEEVAEGSSMQANVCCLHVTSRREKEAEIARARTAQHLPRGVPATRKRLQDSRDAESRP